MSLVDIFSASATGYECGNGETFQNCQKLKSLINARFLHVFSSFIKNN